MEEIKATETVPEEVCAPHEERKKKVVIAVVAAALALAVVAGIGIAVAANQPAPAEPGAPASTSQSEPAMAAVSATVKAEGAGAESTQAVVEVLDEDGKAVTDPVKAVPNEAVALGELPEGNYSLRVVQAPVNLDGSTYKLPEEATAFTVDTTGAPVAVEVVLEKLAAEDMSKEQLEAAAAALAENGRPQESQSVKAKSETAASVPGSDSSVKASPSAPAASSSNKPTTGNGGNSNGGGSGTTTAPSTEPSKPAHTHSWVYHDATYKTVHHDAEYKTVHHDAVVDERYVCNGCEQSFVDSSSLSAHKKEAIRNGNTACTSSRVDNVVVKAAYDEQVIIKDAWDEQVLVSAAYYSCSCGATK